MFKTLVVDDEPYVRDLTQRSLERCGLACDTAADGDEALKLHDQSPYDAVVTDLRMPRRHGHSLAVELLGRPDPPSLLVVTGMAEPRLVRDLISRGVEDVLHKPVNYDILAMKVLALAEKARRAHEPTEIVPSADDHQRKLQKIEKRLSELTSIFSDALTDLFDFEGPLNETPQSVAEFIRRFEQLELSDTSVPKEVLEARRNERVICHHVSAIVVPVNERFAPLDDPFRVALRDVSESGLRMLHTRATNATHLALSWLAETQPGTQLQLVAKVTRCHPLSPFYDIGGQFLTAR